MFKRGPGRQKKLRRREPDESNATKRKRTNITHSCKTCLDYGHNTSTSKKNKHIFLHKNQNIIINEIPTQASQTRNVQKETSKKRRPKGLLNKKGKGAPSEAPSHVLMQDAQAAPPLVTDQINETPNQAPMQDAQAVLPLVTDQINEALSQA
ncbi:unnamed protein product [Lathyrus sativus]|nr:unnamed protein product [Lathyrus sativus]